MADIGWAEYVVFMLVLSVSVGIGVFYGCFGSKQKTTREYLLANRQMPAFPVALSQICTAISAITLLANPVEVYLYGLQYIIVIISLIPFSFSLVYLYIPVYFNLNVKSAYEYIEMRFNPTVRLIVSLLAVVHVIVSMAIAIYAPALAIKQVTGISTEISTGVIYFVCIFYSALGGLKAVLYTDVFQAFIMLTSLLVIAGKGLADIGGFSTMWQRASDGDRLGVLNFDPDFRTRHSVWTCLVGGYFFWLPSYAATQVQVQRFLSMPDMKTVKKSLLINMIGLVVIVSACMLTGLIIFAKYYDCDPLKINAVEKSDQLLPYFVMETVDGIPGLLGLFIAGLTCASMSSLSSGLTALASITTYDYVNQLFPTLSDFKLSTISKVNTFLLGVVSYCFVFVIQNMGSILPVTSSFLGIMLGPTLGIFTLAMMFPWANAKVSFNVINSGEARQGSLSGMILTFIIMVSYVVLNNINSTSMPNQKLPVSIEGCNNETQKSYLVAFIDESQMFGRTNKDWKDSDDSTYIQFLSVSYMWYSAAGTILSVLLGLICSIIVTVICGKPNVRVSYKCLSPPLARFYQRYLPQHIQRWVDYTEYDDCNKSDINLSL